MTKKEYKKMIKESYGFSENGCYSLISGKCDETKEHRPTDTKEFDRRRESLKRFTSAMPSVNYKLLSCSASDNWKIKETFRSFTLSRMFLELGRSISTEYAGTACKIDDEILKHIGDSVDKACKSMAVVVENVIEDNSDFDYHFDYSWAMLEVFNHLLSATVYDHEMSMREATDREVKSNVGKKEYEVYLKKGKPSDGVKCPICGAEYDNLSDVLKSGRCDVCSGRVHIKK